MNEEQKKTILKHLIVSEKDTLDRFEEIVKKSRPLFHIDEATQNIVLEPLPFTNAEKIVLLLVGRYFGKHTEIFKADHLTTREMSDALDIKINTLGAPLLGLIKGGYVTSVEGKSKINHYKVEETLDSLTLKYEKFEKKVTPGLALGNIQGKTNKPHPANAETDDDAIGAEPAASKPKKIANVPRDTPITIKIDPSTLEVNISVFCQQHNIDEDKLRTVVDFQPDGPRIVTFKKDSARTTTQLKALLLLGGIVKNIYQRDSFHGGWLLKNSRLPHDRLDNLSSNAAYRQCFSNKSTASMELTWAGQKQALKMLDEYLKTGVCTL